MEPRAWKPVETAVRLREKSGCVDQYEATPPVHMLFSHRDHLLATLAIRESSPWRIVGMMSA